jgi:hypothetical protein
MWKTWRRGVISKDTGPHAASIKVRLDPGNDLSVVPRKTVRLAPRPTSINGIGTGSMQGYYLMAMDEYRCFAGLIFLGWIELRGDGSYTASVGPPGRYQMNAASNAIVWQSGWAKENGFEGKVEATL